MLHVARQKFAICAPSHNCLAMSSQLRHVSTIGKNLLNSNIFPTCFYNIVNFGPLTAEICSGVWSTPANFNGFRVLTALLHGTLVGGVSQTAALNSGRQLYSAGRPSQLLCNVRFMLHRMFLLTILTTVICIMQFVLD